MIALTSTQFSTLHALADTSHPELGGLGRRRLLAMCDVDQYVNSDLECTDCPQGYKRFAGDDPDNGVTVCTICAADYRVDENNACVACTGGRTNDAGDNTTGTATQCECAVNERVNSTNICEACAPGMTRDAGDNASLGATTCDVTYCGTDERVNSTNACEACGGNSTHVAGADASGSETHCGCALDERFLSNMCSACPAGTTRAAGNALLGTDSVCTGIAYVEVLVVNDKARCDAFDVARQMGGSGEFGPTELAAMHLHTASVVAGVNDIFAQSLNFRTATRIVLVGQVDWCGGDQFDASFFNEATDANIVRSGYPTGETDTSKLLSAFGAWREYNLASIAGNDVAHLFTGRDLVDSSKGDAYQYSACADDASWCGEMDPSEGASRVLREGECGVDANGATVCCYARRGGAVSSVTDPSNAHTDQTRYEASDLVFESALVVAHHLGKQLGMDVDGVGNSSSCASAGFVMSSSTTDDTKRPFAYGGKFSDCSARSLSTQLPTFSCLFRETARSVCGNGVVETERGEECDCGIGDANGVCDANAASGSFVTDKHCNATTCLFIEASIASAPPPPSPSPPPQVYQAHEWCDAECGESYAKGSSRYITDVPWNKCLRCATAFIENDCSDTIAPFKGWVDDTGGVRDTNCAWSGCSVSNAGCGAGETETEAVTCAVNGGSTGTNVKCCQQKPLWTCCGVLACSASPPFPSPPPPPPASSPSPPPPPYPLPSSPAPWGWGLKSQDLEGEAGFEGTGVRAAISLDGTRVAIGASQADGVNGVPHGGRVRVFQYDSGQSWKQVGADLLGATALENFGKRVSLSNDGKLFVIAAPISGVNHDGLVQVFEETNDEWTQKSDDLVGDEDFGYYGADVIVSTSGTTRGTCCISHIPPPCLPTLRDSCCLLHPTQLDCLLIQVTSITND